jgi:hypothetical protein
MEEPISQAEVLRQIGTAQNFLKDRPEINDHIYKAMDEISKMLSKTSQKGGGDISTLVDSHFQIPKSDASLDRFSASVQKFLSSVDELNRELALAIGPVAMIRDMKDPEIKIPQVTKPLVISKYAIIPAINIFLEACRLLVITNRFDNPMLRKILSVVLGVFDIIRGNWKAGVLSLMGIYSRELLVVGLIGKTIGLMYNWISPDIQEKKISIIYSSVKSMIIGGWLHILSIVAPEEIRQKIGQLVPLGDFPQDNIQKIQTLFHDPKIVCALKDKIIVAREEAPIRIVLELLNVPDDLEAFCNGIQTDAGTLAGLEIPKVPELKGGKKPRRFSKID